MNLWFVFLLFLAPIFVDAKRAEKSLVVLITSYNNQRWVERNLRSVAQQKYDNYRILYINDASTDSTAKLVYQLSERLGLSSKIQVINNACRKRGLANYYYTIHELTEDQEIIVCLDGDDWLNGRKVFQEINAAYHNPHVWMTFGNYQIYPSGKEGPYYLMGKNARQNTIVRETNFIPSHLKTFYAWLFKKIQKDDLLYKGEFFPMAWDTAIMLPMIEMAGERYKFIKSINYIYNGNHSLNNHNIDRKYQLALEQHVRSRPPYQRIPD